MAQWVRYRLRMQEICSSNRPVVTGICDPNKSRAPHHRSKKPLQKKTETNIFDQKRFIKNLFKANEKNNSGVLRLIQIMCKLLTLSKHFQFNCQQIQQLFGLLHYILNILFFYLGFLLRTFTIHRTVGKGGGYFYFFKSSLPLLHASQTLRHQPGNYCRQLTSAHSQKLDSNQEPLDSEHKFLTTKLHALK